MAPKIHVTGAPGAGKTTIGIAIAERWGIKHIDADSFAWEISDLPYTKLVDVSCRRSMLGRELGKYESWVLSGSIHYWGEIFYSQLDLAILVVTSTNIRMQRLRTRESNKYGERIRVGGDLRSAYERFMMKARLYDTGSNSVRNLARDKVWAYTLRCRSLFVNGSKPLGRILDIVEPIISVIER